MSRGQLHYPAFRTAAGEWENNGNQIEPVNALCAVLLRKCATLASASDRRNEPGPLSCVFVTVTVAGGARETPAAQNSDAAMPNLWLVSLCGLLVCHCC